MKYWIDTNLSFEYELASRSVEKISRFTQPWNHLLRLLEHFEQAELLRPQSTIGPQDKFALWGVLDRHRQIGVPNLPSAISVENANSKIWCFKNRKQCLPLASIISRNLHERELQLLISSAPKWIVKDPFGVAGRERFNGDSQSEIEHLLNWMAKSDRDELLFEPYIDIEFEFSIHYEITDNQGIEYIGASALLCDKNGVFRGNYPFGKKHQTQLKNARKTNQDILHKLVALGYKGPLSIDAYIGKYKGEDIFQTCSEINARYTFGRMFLELQRVLDRDDFLWWHPSPKIFKKLSLESNQLVFPLDELKQTKTLLLSPVQTALEEIEQQT